MTPSQFELQLRRHKEALGRLITRTLPVKAGTIAVQHFRDNFRQEGFVDSSLQPWKPSKRKSDPKNPDNAYKTLLSRRNNLYRSIKKKAAPGVATVYTDVPYAAAHNEGTNRAGRNHRVRIPKRQFMGQSKQLETKVRDMIDSEVRKVIDTDTAGG